MVGIQGKRSVRYRKYILVSILLKYLNTLHRAHKCFSITMSNDVRRASLMLLVRTNAMDDNDDDDETNKKKFKFKLKLHLKRENYH